MLTYVIDPTALGAERVRPLRRNEYDRLVELGCFDNEKVELLGGTLVAMSPQGTAHAYAVQQLTMLLVPALAGRALVRAQSPLALGDESEPEPDIAVVPRHDYSRAHPSQALLVIEIADSSLRMDRLVKTALYARAGVPEYWIVNLAERAVEVHRGPQGDGYARVSKHHAREVLRPEAFADVEVPIADVLPGL